ncbi:hypothetical protein [Thiomonas sp.]
MRLQAKNWANWKGLATPCLFLGLLLAGVELAGLTPIAAGALDPLLGIVRLVEDPGSSAGLVNPMAGNGVLFVFLLLITFAVVSVNETAAGYRHQFWYEGRLYGKSYTWTQGWLRNAREVLRFYGSFVFFSLSLGLVLHLSGHFPKDLGEIPAVLRDNWNSLRFWSAISDQTRSVGVLTALAWSMFIRYWLWFRLVKAGILKFKVPPAIGGRHLQQVTARKH